MKTSEGLDAIAPALAKAQAAMKPAIKDAMNPAYRSKYADLAAIWDACRGPLTTNGISTLQDITATTDAVLVVTRLQHASGQWIEFGPFSIPVTKHDAHGVGSATSYAKRYGLSAAIGIVAEEDDDGNAAAKAAPVVHALANANVTPASGAREAMSQEQIKRIDKIASDVTDCIAGNNLDAACEVLEDAGLDTDEKVCLWGYFDSKERSALKKRGEERKKERLRELEHTQP